MTRDEKWLLEEKYDGIRTPEFAADCKRLVEGEPLAYVIGWQPFLGLKIYLDSRPLIPRPETEWWTEQLLSEARAIFSATGDRVRRSKKTLSRVKFLDLCAGSGAIGCAALKVLPHTKVFFGELDTKHTATIQKNISENGLDVSRADIRVGDLFEPFGDLQFDVIAVNPPYIPENRELEKSVMDYEPKQALVAGTDGLDVIRRIASELPAHLAKSGTAWVECDSAHAEAAQGLFAEQGLVAEIRTDHYGKPRVIVVSFP